MAWMIRESKRCPNCAQFSEEWRGDDGRTELDPPPFDFEALDCVPCRARAAVQDLWPKDTKHRRLIAVRHKAAPPEDDDDAGIVR